MNTSICSAVSSTFVTVWAFKRNCFLINVSMSTSFGPFVVLWSGTMKINRYGVPFRPSLTRNLKHSMSFNRHYTFGIGAQKRLRLRTLGNYQERPQSNRARRRN